MKQFLRYILTLVAILMVTNLSAQNPNYQGGTWYSLYDATEYKNKNNTFSVFSPTTKSLSFQWKKTGWFISYPIYNLTVSESSNGSSYTEKYKLESGTDKKQDSYLSVTTTVSENITNLKFEQSGSLDRFYKDVKVPLAKHILLNDNTTNGQTWGVPSITLTDNSLATAEGQTSSTAYTIQFRSFLASGNISIESNNPEFHFGKDANGNPVTKIWLGTKDKLCASQSYTGNPGDYWQSRDNFKREIYFSPSVKYKKDTRSTTITITDGTSTAYIYLSAPVIPTYFFKAEANASPAEGGTATATFSNGQDNCSVIATNYTTTSMSATVTFTATPKTADGYVFEGWKTDPASTTFHKQGADQTTITETITSSALNPNGLASQLTLYAIYSRRYTAKITGSNYTNKLVNDSLKADYQFINTQTATPTDSEADPFYFKIDHDFTGNDTREGSPRPDEVIAYDPVTNTITALNEGTATITFYQKNTDSHEPVSESFTVQVIKHTPSFALKSDPLYFNKEYPDYFTTNANSPLTITSSDELVAKWVQGSNPQSYTLKTFSKTNTATLTAIQHENYYWARLEESIDIQLQNPNNHVQNTPLTQENYIKDFQYSYQDPAADPKSPMGPDWNDGIYFGGEGTLDGDEGWNWGEKYIIINFSGVPDSIYFTANRSNTATGTIKLSIKQGTSPNNFEENIWESSEASNNNIGRKLKSDPTYNYIKISYEGNLWGRFKDVRITELNQFEAIDANKQKVTAIDFGKDQHVDAEQRRTFNFRYANAGYNVKFEVVSDTPENTANAKKYITLSHNDFVTLNGEKYLTSIGGEKSGTVENITVQLYSKEDEYVIPANTKIKISDEVGHTYYVSLSGNIARANQTLSWQGLFQKDPVILPLTTGTFTNVATSSNPDLPITYTSSNPDVIAVSADGKSLTPKAEGEVFITANQAGNAKYNPADPITKAVVVTGKKVQVIIWETNLTDLVVGDTPVTLSAKVYWIDMDNGAQGVYSEEQTRKLQFTSADPSIVSIEGNILTIHNAGETTVTAYVPGDDTYKEDQQIIPVRVRPATEWCDDVLLLNSPDEYEFYIFDLNRPELISPIYTIDHSKGVPGTLEFQHTGKPWTFAIEYYGGTIHAQQSIDGSNWTTVATVTPTKNETYISEGSLLDRQAKYIRFVRAEGGVGYHYISNIKVYPAQYIESSVAEKDFGTVNFGSNNTFTFDVAYSNIKYQLSPKTSASDVQVSPTSFGSCGAFGTQTITATWTPNEGGDNITRTITITDINTGKSATVTLKANVNKKDQYIKWEDAPTQIDEYTDIDSRPRKTVNASNEEVRDITYEIVEGADIAAFDNGMFYIKGTGDIRIRAYHNGDAEYKPVELFKEIKITSMSPTFVGTNSQDWATSSNWVNNTKPTAADDFAVILAPVTIAEEISAKGLQIASAGAIHITAKGGLTVGERGVVNSTDDTKISIDNNLDGAGFLRINPQANDIPNQVTVHYTTRTYDNGNPRNEVWQYIGMPGENGQISSLEGVSMYHWKETSGWIQKSATDLKNIPAWDGYAFTQSKEKNATFKINVEPILENKEIHFTCTPKGMKGDNLFVNSYLAPIDVTKIDEKDIVDPNNNLVRTFFLFNSGSWNDWNKGAGDITANGYDKSSAGHYYSIPFYSTKFIDDGTTQVVIPSMQGVYVYSAGESSIKLDYNKHVLGAKNMHNPMRAPQQLMEDESFRRVRIQASSENSGADRMYIVQEKNTTPGYDNGYDGDNINASGQVNIYVNEPFGQLEVACSNHIDSTCIGFTAGVDTTYTLTFGAVVGEDMYLVDNLTDSLMHLSDGNQYTFYAQPNSVNDTRFRLVVIPNPKDDDSTNNDGETSNVDNISTTARLWINNNIVYVIDAPHNSSLSIYSVSGMCIQAPHTIHHSPCTIDLSHLPTGVYVLRLNDKAFKIVCD